MPFPFICPSCRHTSQVLDHLAGTQAKCPSCGVVVSVPAPAPGSVKSGLLPILLAVVAVFGLFCCAGGGIGGFLLYRLAKKPSETMVVQVTSDTAAAKTEQADRTQEEQSSLSEENQPPAYWVRILKEGDADRSEQARQRLVKFGALAVPELRKVIRDSDPAMRLAVLATLGEIGDLAYDAVGDVAAALGDREASVRVAAARALAQMGKPARSALPALLAASADPHPGVREAVAETLRRFSPITKNDAAKLAPLLREGATEQRVANLATLRALKPDADTSLELFGPLLSDPERKIRLEALAALADTGKSARSQVLAKLFPMLDDAEPEVRTAAETVLARLGPPVVADLPLLLAGLRGKESESRRYSAEALGSLGPEAAPAVPSLARALSDPDSAVRVAALVALDKIGKPALDVIDDVIAVRSDPEPAVRKGVLRILRLAGRKPDVLAATTAGLTDADEVVRAAAIEALRALKPPLGKDDVLIFNTALKSDKVEVRRYAATELERLGADSRIVLPTLLEKMKDPDPEVRRSIYGALAAIGPPATLAAPALVEEMTAAIKADMNDSGAPERFRLAAYALAQIGEMGRLMPLLRRGLNSKNQSLRKETATALGMIGSAAKEFIPDLCAMLGEAELRIPAAVALSKLGRVAVPELEKVLEGGPRDAKLGAIEALKLMRPEDARDARTALYKLAREYKNNDVGAAARAVYTALNQPKKN